MAIDLLGLYVFGYGGVFLIGLGFGIIPFLGPSNMLIAFWVLALWQQPPFGQNPPTALDTVIHICLVSLAISIGVSIAKSVHYYIMLRSRRFLSEERRKGLDRAKIRIGRWASFAVFLAASTPIPDEPIVFTVALMKYSWTKFLLFFFAGKVIVTIAGGVAGVLLGRWITGIFGDDLIFIVVSIVLTVVFTGVLLNWATAKVSEAKGDGRTSKRKATQPRDADEETQHALETKNETNTD